MRLRAGNIDQTLFVSEKGLLHTLTKFLHVLHHEHALDPHSCLYGRGQGEPIKHQLDVASCYSDKPSRDRRARSTQVYLPASMRA